VLLYLLASSPPSLPLVSSEDASQGNSRGRKGGSEVNRVNRRAPAASCEGSTSTGTKL